MANIRTPNNNNNNNNNVDYYSSVESVSSCTNTNNNTNTNTPSSINSVSDIDELIQNYLSIENFMNHISIKNNKSKSYGHTNNRSFHRTYKNKFMENNDKIRNLVEDYNNLLLHTTNNTNNVDNGNKMAYIYARTSTKQQEGMVSIDVQCVELLKICYEKKLKLEGIYIDDGKSAKTNKNLGSLTLLKKNACAGSYVYIYDVSRLSRNSKEGIDTLDTLSNRGVDIYFKTEGINYKGSYNKNIIRKALSDSQYLSESITEKVNNAIKIKRQMGHHIGGIPYGYMRQNNVLVINKKEYDAIKYVNKVYSKFNLNCLTAHKKSVNILTNVNKKYPNGFRGKPFTMKHVKLCVQRINTMSEKTTTNALGSTSQYHV